MANCAVIIPVHEYNDTVKAYLLNAIESVVYDKEKYSVNIYISCPSSIAEAIDSDVPKDVEIIESEGDTSFQALVNRAVEDIDEDWFSILEFDDVFTSIWVEEFSEYCKFYPETSVFMPLTDLVREINGKKTFVGYGNEAPLASAFSNELCYVDFEVLESYFDFYLTGSFFNKKDFMSVGELKESMKLTFWYEFMLRATHKGKKIQVIPKVGYTHLIDRKNSLYSIYKKTMDEKENRWWQKTAKEEYKFLKDRNKKYNNKGKEE